MKWGGGPAGPMRQAPVALLAALVGSMALTASVVACSGATITTGDEVSDAAASDASTAEASVRDRDSGGESQSDASSDESDATAPPAFDAGSACKRDPKYDFECAARGQPPAANICYDPGGEHIPTTCVINLGTLLVCCPL